MKENSIPNDTVYSEIKEIAKQNSDKIGRLVQLLWHFIS